MTGPVPMLPADAFDIEADATLQFRRLIGELGHALAECVEEIERLSNRKLRLDGNVARLLLLATQVGVRR